ncbi:3-alpha-(or 20-beta)-hydroxysteroid dehydrogenase [Mycolicibacterium phlei]|uniref:glucose 1-dehydrogenase n=1 Tax=Mycobacteroides chelonae TaxID=1774 RepID=UPI000618B0C6|nr:glucose 1-dehydrogenase [Mycobacteroides chelonae]VEG20433.1 3-alpha-(or 20-beta)-hydroxysteroid dehydrogenase [Mycolicibacterium phlei]AKC40761.1 3-alpha-hydroxysteroid dehydrogenase [Mycobacteroides chelonae]ANB00479.1 3-alpha-hydroxysteroid dehydrogenase [Mycobacteroides chelonae CCUG 47445]OLT81807.1 3-alpha-hydroxysteroid dehydrogenase [Mycobacteroides chelonae]ORV14374.1 3-alpha-hydroxysteroid dehydrogenase [Mycobacteroides chelonae]
MGRVTGKIALISGGARGMGAAHARALVDEGANVMIGDLLDEAGEALAADLGPSARYVHLDVTDKQQWIDAVAATNSAFGPVNVLINNAGIANGNLLTDFELTEWQRILDINLTGTFLGCQAVAQTMIDNKAGSIINISSVEGYRGSPGLHGYTATKFAVRGLTKSVALELAPHGVRVNSVHPGLIRTDMTAGIPEDFLQIPLGRAADPAEVSALVLYLASDESSYSTAAEFLIDGGLIAGVPHKTS